MEQKEYVKKRFSQSKEANLWSDMYVNPQSPFHYHMKLRRDRSFEQIKSLPKDSKILDLGCGAGPLLSTLNENQFDVTGVDISFDMLSLAMDSGRESGHAPAVLQGNTEALPFPDNQFDVVVSLGMFGYVENVHGALAEIKRILKPDGVFIFSIRNRFHHILFDPHRLFKFVYNKARSFLRKRKKGAQKPKGADAYVINTERGFLIDIFDNPQKVIEIVSKEGFVYSDLEGIGYGPLLIHGNRIVPDKVSMKFSQWTESFLRFTRIHGFTKWISDVNIYRFENQ